MKSIDDESTTQLDTKTNNSSLFSFLSSLTYKTDIKTISNIKTKSPLFAQYEITSGCNYDCFFCYNVWKSEGRKQNRDLKKESQFKVIDKLNELEIFGLLISGGEPLLIPYLPDIVKSATNYNIETGVTPTALLFIVLILMTFDL